MFETYITYVEIGILVLSAIFAILKLVLIKRYVNEKHSFDLFIRTMFIVSKQEIKNTFNKKVAKYYTISNMVNRIAYLYFSILLFCYVFLLLL